MSQFPTVDRITLPSTSACFPNWRKLYVAALFETDRKKLPSSIANAVRALSLRARELFTMPDGSNEEREELEDALYALQALRHCLELRTNECEHT